MRSLTRGGRGPLAAAGAGVLALWFGCGGATVSTSDVASLSNVYLGPEYSLWLVGPLARLTSVEERAAYLSLRDDALAARFIEDFWVRHNPRPRSGHNPGRELFDERAAKADRLYSEAGYLGRRTDRGTIYIIYGPPNESSFELPPRPESPPIEMWRYARDSPVGLDGLAPAAAYRFTKLGDLTVFYRALGAPMSGGAARPGELRER